MADPRFTPPPLTDAEGQPWNETIGTAENIAAGRYAGPEGQAHYPWNCPACGVQNEGRLELGCVHCGAGKPGYHVDTPPPSAAAAASFARVSEDMRQGMETLTVQSSIYPAADAWAEAHAAASLAEAFVAGYMLARAHTMTAPPVTTDVRTLAPHTKAQRTIIAALELFRDQVLGSAEEEIATGEWCSVAEVEALIAQLKAQL